MSVPVTGAGPAGGVGDVSSPNVVKQTNDVRVQNGAGSLRLDPLLTRAAQLKAEDMAARGYFAHQAPDGRTPWDWIESTGYEFLAAAENLAVGYPTDAELIAAWMHSEGHRHNLLNQKYTDIGIGIARGMYKGQDSLFVVQMFGKPRVAHVTGVLAARRMPMDPLSAPSVPLVATDFRLDPTPLAGVALASTSLPVDLLALPTVPLARAEPEPLASSDIPLDLIHAPALPLRSRVVDAGACRLPRSLPRSRRTTMLLKRAH
jgi:hypothetical protein